MHRTTLLMLAGAVAALPAHAAEASRRSSILNLSALDPGERATRMIAPRAPTDWPSGPDGRQLSASRDLSGAFGAVARGGWGADVALSTMESGFESLAVLPANLVGQQDVVTWGGAAAGVTGRSVFAPVTAGVLASHYGAVSDAVAGNATTKLRGIANPAFAPDTFFGRWARYEFVRTNSATGGVGTRFLFQPGFGQDLRAMHDAFVTSIDSMWASEPTGASFGVIVARLLWGGLNFTTDIGLPIGPVTDFYTLGPESATFMSDFLPCTTPATYRSGAPYPGGAGHNVPVPVGVWFTIIHETTASGRLRHLLDLHDGAGEFVIFDGPLPSPGGGRVDRIAFSGAFETAGDACYIDNLRAEGVQYLTCLRPQGDLDFDGDIDFGDLNAVLSNFGAAGNPGSVPGDVNSDGVVNFADLNLVLSNFGASC